MISHSIKLKLLLSLLVLLLCVSGISRADDYKPYTRKAQAVEIGSITFDDKSLAVSLEGAEQPTSITVKRSTVTITLDGSISIGRQLTFDRQGITVAGYSRLWDEVHDVRILESDGLTTISLLSMPEETSLAERLRRSSRISFDDDLVVPEDVFIRGIVFTVSGDIEVYGEVNRDIVSLFGDIYIGPVAVARGDIAGVSGRVDVASDASVYGEIYTSGKRRVKSRRGSERHHDAVSDRFLLNYNRVDGLYLQEGLGYSDSDSLLPSVWAEAGYAFASKRWRYELGMEQTILRSLPISISGRYSRKLVSHDDWLLDNGENTVFALLVKEDFKDYYEAEGAYLGLTTRPLKKLVFDVGFFTEETRWLPSHRNLWSLFGGDKHFRQNYSTADSTVRSDGAAMLDSLDNAGLRFRADFDTRANQDVWRKSAWHLTGELEYASPDFGSDFDYRRYSLSVRRYQKLTRRTTLILRGVWAGSDGWLPMHKRLFLGGLGTLRGYKHKELLGTEFWLANAEYRFTFPRTDLGVSLIYDVGQIANDQPLSSDVEIKHSLGMAVHLGDNLRLSVAKRLDGALDDDAQLYVRLKHRL